MAESVDINLKNTADSADTRNIWEESGDTNMEYTG